MVGALTQENFWRPQIFAPVFYLICFAFTFCLYGSLIPLLLSLRFFLAPPSAGALMQRITCIMGSAGPVHGAPILVIKISDNRQKKIVGPYVLNRKKYVLPISEIFM